MTLANVWAKSKLQEWDAVQRASPRVMYPSIGRKQRAKNRHGHSRDFCVKIIV
jgi:hypothetical protein